MVALRFPTPRSVKVMAMNGEWLIEITMQRETYPVAHIIFRNYKVSLILKNNRSTLCSYDPFKADDSKPFVTLELTVVKFSDPYCEHLGPDNTLPISEKGGILL